MGMGNSEAALGAELFERGKTRCAFIAQAEPLFTLRRRVALGQVQTTERTTAPAIWRSPAVSPLKTWRATGAGA